MALTQIIEAIGSPMFEDRTSEWESVLSLGKRKNFPRGTIIDHTVNKEMIYIQKGLVKQSIIADGIEKVIGLFKGGSILGEALLFHGCPPQCVLTAVENTVGYLFSKKMVEQLIKNNESLLSEILKSMSLKIRTLTTQAEIMICQSAEEKVGKLIYLLVHQQKNQSLYISLTHQSLADLAGLHRVTVSSVLSKLRKKEVIDFSRGCLKIKNLEWFNRYVKRSKI